MKITIKVTIEDIDNGDRLNCWSCPVALAMFRATGDRWIVESEQYMYRLGERSRKVALPDAVSMFVWQFDARDARVPSPSPFEFEIEIPERLAA